MVDSLKIKISSAVAEIELNRPEKANALDEELWFGLSDIFCELDENPAIRVCILSGAGTHFTSGIDLQFLQSMGQEVEHIKCAGRKSEFLRRKIKKLQAAFTQIENFRKPVIAAIHGSCYGGGIDLISACDFRYSTNDAVFQIKETDLGITADVGTLQRLPKLIPHGIVRELAYTGRKFSGIEARDFGLINNCYADYESMISAVRDVAQQITAKSPLAICGVKQILLHSRDNSVAEGLNYVATWNSAMLISDDLEESIMAMMQNRSPEYND